MDVDRKTMGTLKRKAGHTYERYGERLRPSLLSVYWPEGWSECGNERKIGIDFLALIYPRRRRVNQEWVILDSMLVPLPGLPSTRELFRPVVGATATQGEELQPWMIDETIHLAKQLKKALNLPVRVPKTETHQPRPMSADPPIVLDAAATARLDQLLESHPRSYFYKSYDGAYPKGVLEELKARPPSSW